MSIVSPRGSVLANSTVNSKIGDVVVLACMADGGPGNRFEWIKDDNRSRVGATAVINIAVNSVTSGGVYTCVVMNIAGNETFSTMVNGKNN